MGNLSMNSTNKIIAAAKIKFKTKVFRIKHFFFFFVILYLWYLKNTLLFLYIAPTGFRAEKATRTWPRAPSSQDLSLVLTLRKHLPSSVLPAWALFWLSHCHFSPSVTSEPFPTPLHATAAHSLVHPCTFSSSSPAAVAPGATAHGKAPSTATSPKAVINTAEKQHSLAATSSTHNLSASCSQ